MTSSTSDPLRDTGRPRRVRPTALVAEILGGVVALGSVCWLALSSLGAGLAFFGEQSRFDAAEVRTYWTTLVVLGLACAVALGGAIARRARLGLAWHLGVAVLGLGVALVLPVTEVGPAHYPLLDAVTGVEAPRSPAPDPAPGCHSGGDSDGCVGG